MKINSDLRAAVRSAYAVQKRDHNDHETQVKAARVSIDAFLKRKPRIHKQILDAFKRIDQLRADIAVQEAIISATGLAKSFYSDSRYGQYRIESHDKFVKAGGLYDYKEPVRWSFDEVMALLAAAKSEKDGAAILKKYGINWT